MNPELKVNFTPEGQTGVLLIGTALTPKEPVKLVINGNFTAVSSYINGKKNDANTYQEILSESAIVTCDEENLTIKLETNPNDVYGTVVTGTAELSEELSLFGINQTKFFNREQLVKIFRFNRRFFPNREEHQKLIMSYQSFKASVSKELSVESDQRGNRANHSSKMVKTDLPESFVISIPLFKGYDPVTFPVEICIEENDSGCRFWFESIDLAEILETKKKEMFSNELNYCEGLTVIYK